MNEAAPAATNVDQTETRADRARDSFEELAEEFAVECRKGESHSISEYEKRYPEHAEKIRKLLPTVALLEQLRRAARRDRGDDAQAESLPERLGEFHVLRELGRGGMGVVYEAVQESLGRHVALKVVYHVHLNAKRLERFRREAQAVARLHHTNIVPIFGVGDHEGLPYYVMQYIKGTGLDDLVETWRNEGARQDAARWRFVARVGVQAALALDYAHAQGVLHRDIKPSNLLIDEQQTIWITDFGLAKLTGQDDLTASGDIVGTLRYLAPEALEGETDPRSDVYSLGLLLYELLTLKSPFGELSPSELLRHVIEEKPIRPRKLDPAIPRDLETIVLKATAREPGGRYKTAGALAEDLNRFLEDRPILARRADPGRLSLLHVLAHFRQVAVGHREERHVRADAHVILAADVQRVRHVRQVILQRRLPCVLGQIRQHVNAHHATLVRQCPQIAILLVARMRVHRPAARMSEERRPGGCRNPVGGGAGIGVAQVERNADGVHAPDRLTAQVGQALLVAVEAPGAEPRPVIVG